MHLARMWPRAKASETSVADRCTLVVHFLDLVLAHGRQMVQTWVN